MKLSVKSSKSFSYASRNNTKRHNMVEWNQKICQNIWWISTYLSYTLIDLYFKINEIISFLLVTESTYYHNLGFVWLLCLMSYQLSVTHWPLTGRLVWILKTECAAVSESKKRTAKMPRKLRRWDAWKKNVWAAGGYIMTKFSTPVVCWREQLTESTRYAVLGASHGRRLPD